MKYLPFLFLSILCASDDNAPANRTKDRQVDIKHIKINVTVDLKAKSVFGHVTHTLSPLRSNLSSFILHGDDMKIRRIRMGGKDLKYTHSSNEIHIDLPNPISWDETVDVRIDYIANPREGTYFLDQMILTLINPGKHGRRERLKIIITGFLCMIIRMKEQPSKQSLL